MDDATEGIIAKHLAAIEGLEELLQTLPMVEPQRLAIKAAIDALRACGPGPWRGKNNGVRTLSEEWDEYESFTTEDMARILGLHRNSVYAAMNNGQIPYIQIGRRKMVGRADLERLLGYR